jgi:hypothetical protein
VLGRRLKVLHTGIELAQHFFEAYLLGARPMAANIVTAIGDIEDKVGS